MRVLKHGPLMLMNPAIVLLFIRSALKTAGAIGLMAEATVSITQGLGVLNRPLQLELGITLAYVLRQH